MAIDDNTSYELTGYQVKDLANKVRGKADTASLASVATSGLYSDLIGKPTIPTVNNGTLTIQQNGTNVQTFTANQSANATANVETIYSVDVSSTQPITQVVSTAMIQDEAVTTAKIDDEAVTASKVDPTSFAVLVYVGEIAFVRQTYNNSLIHLTDKIDFYAASDVSAAITSSTNLVMTLPVGGSYIARVKASLWTNGNTWDYMLMAIRKNGDGFARAMGPKISGAWGFVNAEGYTTIANGDALTVYLNTNGNNFSDGNITGQDSKLIVEIYKVG